MRKYRMAFIAVVVASFIVLGGTGVRVYLEPVAGE